MILINNKTDKSIICTSVYVAYKIGVSPVTVWRWKTSGREKEEYNHWTVYLKPVRLKQKSGFNVTPQPTIVKNVTK